MQNPKHMTSQLILIIIIIGLFAGMLSGLVGVGAASYLFRHWFIFLIMASTRRRAPRLAC